MLSLTARSSLRGPGSRIVSLLYIQKGTTIGLYTLGCVGWNRTTDLQLMRLASYHCYYLAICRWSTKCGDRTFLLFLFGKI